MGQNETQQAQRRDGLLRRKRQRWMILNFEGSFRQKKGRAPTYEEVAAHFHRSRTWVANLKRGEAEDNAALGGVNDPTSPK